MAASIPQLRDDLASAGAENARLRARIVELESRPPVIVTQEVQVERIVKQEVIKEVHIDNPDHIAMIRSLQAKLRDK